MPPASSKKRSKTRSSIVATTPRASLCAVMYSESCGAAAGPRSAPAVGEWADTSRSRAAQHAVDLIAVEERAPTPQAWRGPLGQKLHDVVEVISLEFFERRRLPNEGKERVFAPLTRSALGHDLLRQNVERDLRRLDAIEQARGDRSD